MNKITAIAIKYSYFILTKFSCIFHPNQTKYEKKTPVRMLKRTNPARVR